jgi:hypothetical protein
MKSLKHIRFVIPALAVAHLDAQVIDAPPEAVIPKAFPASRYEASWSKNPFLLKTAPVTQPTVSFAQDWVLSSMYNYSGRITVRLMNRQTGEYKTIRSDDAGGEFTLVKANIARSTKESSVEIKRGTEVATLTYDDQMLARPLSSPAPAPIQNAIKAGAARTPQQAQAQARAATAAAQNRNRPPTNTVGNANRNGPIVVGRQPSQVAQNNLTANGLPPGVLAAGGAPATGNNNTVTVDVTGNNGASSTPTSNVDTGHGPAPNTPTTVTRRRRLIPNAVINNP